MLLHLLPKPNLFPAGTRRRHQLAYGVEENSEAVTRLENFNVEDVTICDIPTISSLGQPWRSQIVTSVNLVAMLVGFH